MCFIKAVSDFNSRVNPSPGRPFGETQIQAAAFDDYCGGFFNTETSCSDSS